MILSERGSVMRALTARGEPPEYEPGGGRPAVAGLP